MALRRRRTYSSSVTEADLEGGLADQGPSPGSLRPRPGPPRPSRVGGSGRRRAPQARRLTDDDADDAGLGQAHTDDARRDRHHPARDAGAARRARHGRPADQTGGVDIRSHVAVTDAKTDNETLLTDLEGEIISLWLEVDEDIDWSVLLDQVLLDLAPVCCNDSGRRPRVREVRRRPRAHRRDQPGLDARPPPRTSPIGLADGHRVFVVDATEVHDRGASDAQELAHSLRSVRGTCAP